MGPEFALGAAENRGPDKSLFGGEEERLPVGFPGRTDAEYQGGIGKTTGHGLFYHEIRGNTKYLPFSRVNFMINPG
jgi:hypothetical protein